MLIHSPPLPLAIDYYREPTAEDQEDILHALQYCDRVRHIALIIPTANLQRVIMATDKQFSTLERLYILATDYNSNRSLIFPKTFQAPHLRYPVLWGAVPAVGFSFTTAMNLVTLGLYNIPPFAYFTPSSLFTRLSLMSQLESLAIAFDAHVINREFNNQLFNTPIMSQVALPNLRWFWFRGFSTYLDDVFAQISAPLLKTLSINIFAQFTLLAIPHFLQFVSSSENLGFRTVLLGFEALSRGNTNMGNMGRDLLAHSKSGLHRNIAAGR
jgi:hypothetical protein